MVEPGASSGTQRLFNYRFTSSGADHGVRAESASNPIAPHLERRSNKRLLKKTSGKSGDDAPSFRAVAAHNVTRVPIKSRLPTSTPRVRKIS
jgi:hypothetical protein